MEVDLRQQAHVAAALGVRCYDALSDLRAMAGGDGRSCDMCSGGCCSRGGGSGSGGVLGLSAGRVACAAFFGCGGSDGRVSDRAGVWKWPLQYGGVPRAIVEGQQLLLWIVVEWRGGMGGHRVVDGECSGSTAPSSRKAPAPHDSKNRNSGVPARAVVAVRP